MKRTLLLLAVCMSLSIAGNAQTRKPVEKATKTVKTSAEPSANGKFKFSTDGFFNDNDSKNFIVITAQGKKSSDIMSSVVSTLSSMYSNPSKVVSTLGDNIINVTASSKLDVVNDLIMVVQRYTFTYNIKIEIKDGKIKVDSPCFSNINRRDIGMVSRTTMDNKNQNTSDFFGDLSKADKASIAEFEEVFNSHVTKIVSGLSSNMDW